MPQIQYHEVAIFFNFTTAPWLNETRLRYEADPVLRAEHPNDAQVSLGCNKAAIPAATACMCTGLVALSHQNTLSSAPLHVEGLCCSYQETAEHAPACVQWWLPDAPDIAARAVSVKSAAEMLQHLQRMSKEEVARRLRQVHSSALHAQSKGCRRLCRGKCVVTMAEYRHMRCMQHHCSGCTAPANL